MSNLDPGLWWLNFEFPNSVYDRVISIVRVRDAWIMTTEGGIYELSVGRDGHGVCKPIHYRSWGS